MSRARAAAFDALVLAWAAVTLASWLADDLIDFALWARREKWK